MLQFLPLLVMLLFSFLSLFGGQEDLYAFQASRYYNFQRTTSRNNVDYYVNQNVFMRKFPREHQQRDLDAHVEREYLRNLRHLCNQEKELQRFKISQASNWFSVDEEALKDARNMPLRHCERLYSWNK